MLVRPLDEDDRPWAVEALRRGWGSTSVARKGALVDAARLAGFVAVADGRRVGLLTYARRADEVEVVTLQAETEGGGIGRALMDAVVSHGRAAGASRIWLVTTNDNIRAIGFYQRFGLDLVAYIGDGVAACRRLKPSIPLVSADGIDVRHELEFELRLRDRPTLDEVAGDDRGPFRFWPEGYQALARLSQTVKGSGIDPVLLELVKMRASQINGCAYCIDMHSKDARAAGETEQRLYALSAWRETPFFSERERAALALTEAVTRIADGQVPPTVINEAAAVFGPDALTELLYAVIEINAWNRLAITTGAPEPGTYRGDGAS
jgi:AhpD family alkylhydroperoxidase